MGAYLAGGKIWIDRPGSLSCLGPASGKELADIKVNDAAGPVVGDRCVYVWTPDGLTIIDPLPAPCG